MQNSLEIWISLDTLVSKNIRLVVNEYIFLLIIIYCSITKASIDLNNKSMQDMNKEFDKIEKQIKTPEIYDDERLSLEENILKQKVKITAYVLLTCYTVFPYTSLVPFWPCKV